MNTELQESADVPRSQRTMPDTRRSNPVVTALYVNAALVAILIVVLLGHSGGEMLPAAMAQPQQPIAGGSGIFIMPGQFSTNTWGCYLLDVDQQTLAAYQYMPGDKNLRLVAARNFQYDRRLKNFNTVPDPQEINTLVQKEASPPRTVNPDLAPQSAEEPGN